MSLFSICILTYKREELLEKLIKSIINQEGIKISDLEIIIVDNDPNKSALKVLEKFNYEFSCKMKYFLQTEKNLSLSRNLAIDKSSSKYIIFIDDDEFADSFWLINLYNCIEKTNADIVFGNLKLYFDEKVPPLLRDISFYYPPIEKIKYDNPRYYYTGNCIMRGLAIKNSTIRFDLKYGLTGGEDADFFERLSKLGLKMKFCKSAIIYEWVSEERGKIKYLLKRHFRYGNTYMNRQLEKISGLNRLLLFIKISFKLFLFLLAITLFLMNLRIGIRILLNFFSTIGQIFSFFKYRLKMYNS